MVVFGWESVWGISKVSFGSGIGGRISFLTLFFKYMWEKVKPCRCVVILLNVYDLSWKSLCLSVGVQVGQVDYFSFWYEIFNSYDRISNYFIFLKVKITPKMIWSVSSWRSFHYNISSYVGISGNKFIKTFEIRDLGRFNDLKIR